jgi:DNA cross-link repair 1A protein
MASQTREIKEISFGRTKVIVDGFAFPNPFVRHYFLTHCHSDHTIGLKKSFSQGVIYCSEAAGNLLRHDFRLQNPQLIRPLKLHETVAVVEGLRVTAMSANHSPDAVMFLFDYVECGVERRIVHTGDFRFSPDMLTAGNGLLLAKPIERLYLVRALA